MTKAATKWSWLTTQIPVFSDGAISMMELASILKMSKRDLRRSIEAARSDGIIICSTSVGYYIPQTAKEIQAYIRYMLSRIETTWGCLVPSLHTMNLWMQNERKTCQDIQDRLVLLNKMISQECLKNSENSKE